MPKVVETYSPILQNIGIAVINGDINTTKCGRIATTLLHGGENVSWHMIWILVGMQ